MSRTNFVAFDFERLWAGHLPPGSSDGKLSAVGNLIRHGAIINPVINTSAQISTTQISSTQKKFGEFSYLPSGNQGFVIPARPGYFDLGRGGGLPS